MPNWMRGLAAALLLLAAVYAATLFPRREKPPAIPAAPGEIVKFLIEGQGVVIELEKAGQDWRMRRPVDYPANGENVEYFLEAARALRAETVLTRRADKHADYGLAGSGVKKVSLWAAGTAGPVVWLLGKQTSAGGAFLTLPGASEVYLTSGLPADDVAMDPDRWRESRVFPVNEPLVRITVKESGRVLEIVRSSDAWMVNGKPDNREQLMATVNNIAGMNAEGFIDPPAAHGLKNLGLAPPARTLEARFASGRTFLLKLGKTDQERLVVQRDGEPTLLWVKAALLSIRADPKKFLQPAQ